MTFSINDAAATFEAAVRGVSTTDPVLGGTAGEANMAATDLALRTKYLKAKLEALGAVGTWTEVQFAADGSFTVPAGVEQVIVKRAKAPGGGGAGCWQTTDPHIHPGGGGGEGAEVVDVALAVTPGWSLDIVLGTVGAGGTAISSSNTYASGVLGSAATDLTVKHGATTLLTVGGGLGGGISSGNPSGAGGSGVTVGMQLGGAGGTATVDGITTKGTAGGDASALSALGGWGGGKGGGQPYVGLPSSATRAATTAGDGGGGAGGAGAGENGKAGALGSLRLGYWAFDITGNT